MCAHSPACCDDELYRPEEGHHCEAGLLCMRTMHVCVSLTLTIIVAKERTPAGCCETTEERDLNSEWLSHINTSAQSRLPKIWSRTQVNSAS